MGWLRLVGSIKSKVFFFAEYSLFYRALLQKRPIIYSMLLTGANPYQSYTVSHLAHQAVACHITHGWVASRMDDSDTWMSRVTYKWVRWGVNESRTLSHLCTPGCGTTHEWVTNVITSDTWISHERYHIRHMNESRTLSHLCTPGCWTPCHTWMSHVTSEWTRHMDESCHI